MAVIYTVAFSSEELKTVTEKCNIVKSYISVFFSQQLVYVPDVLILK